MKKNIQFLSALYLFFSSLSFSIQACAQSDEALKKEFLKFDTNDDQWLDGIEITNCKCNQYDTNNDKEVTFSEFKAGRLGKNKIAVPTTSTVSSNTKPGLAVGSKVEINYHGTWYSGTILEVNGEKYKFRYDQYDSNWDTWVTKESLRSKNNTDNNSQAGNYKIGEKVEVWQTTWYPANVLEVKNGSYKIRYYSWVDSPDEWVGENRIRAFGSTKEYSRGSNADGKRPEMAGTIPKITGTSWAVVSIYTKGTVPEMTRRHNYIFCNNGGWEFQAGTLTSGTYKINGNRLTVIMDGADRKTSTYIITWNQEGNYVELDDGESIIRMEYNRKTTC